MIAEVPQGRINWRAIENAQCWFREEFKEELAQEREKYGVGCSSDTWCKWILENGGLKHEALSIEVVDEQKYLLFLLKFG